SLIIAASTLFVAAELKDLPDDHIVGVDVVRRVIIQPSRRIALNAGVDGSVVVSRVSELMPNEIYNAATGDYGNLIDAGIIDPVKVTRSALANAGSIAGMVLTTETLVADQVEDEED